MKLRNKGQFGPLGEDMMYFFMVVLAIGFILAITLNAFVDYKNRFSVVDGYRMSLNEADKIALDLACEYGVDKVKTMRVLDKTKIDKSINDVCSKYSDKVGVCVRDLRDITYKPSCGKSTCSDPSLTTQGAVTNIRLPVSIRMNDKTYDPGVLEVTMSQE